MCCNAYSGHSFDADSTDTILVTKLYKEVLLRVPRPSSVPQGVVPSMPMVKFAGKKYILVVLGKGASITIGPQDGVKVIYGEVEVTGHDGKKVKRTIAPDAKERASTLLSPRDGKVTAGSNGTVFLHIEHVPNENQGPFKTMAHLPITNIFPDIHSVPPEVRAMEFPFIKVDTLGWAQQNDPNGRPLWKDFEFYNMTGFHVYFNDDAMEQIAHIQAWTLGIGETARFHNHSDKSFCEIHCCIRNGTGHGGMRYFAEDDTQPIDQLKELEKGYVEKNSKLIEVPSMYEHGPLWKIQDGCKARPKLRPNDTVDYPWHAWLAGGFGDHHIPINPPLAEEDQSYDVWLAFEFPSSAFQF